MGRFYLHFSPSNDCKLTQGIRGKICRTIFFPSEVEEKARRQRKKLRCDISSELQLPSRLSVP